MSTLLSVVIITKNEESNIERCLKSLLTIADDIVIFDSYSTDKTRELSLKYPVQFVEHPWLGYAQTKNLANQKARYDWILSLDADEELSETLQKSILEIKNAGIEHACKINRLTNYCGKWIRHSSWYPDHKIRIFNRKNAEWQGDYVHEKLCILNFDPEITLLKGHCYHYSVKSIEDHVAQVNKFSTLSALEQLHKGKKPSWVKLLFSPVSKFIGIYFFKSGFRDGLYGFSIAVISAYSRFLRALKLYQMTRDSHRQ
jgi:glycosyltransferase involved in cell wall biosynthesis